MLLEERPGFREAFGAHRAALLATPGRESVGGARNPCQFPPDLADELSYYVACRRCRVAPIPSEQAAVCVICCRVHRLGGNRKTLCRNLGGWAHVACLDDYARARDAAQ
jgi:hypothetical protein